MFYKLYLICRGLQDYKLMDALIIVYIVRGHDGSMESQPPWQMATGDQARQ